METVNPSPGLYASVLHVLSRADPRTRSMASVMGEFLDQLTTAEAGLFPHAVGDVLPLLRGDPERLRFASEIAARLDLFEVAPSLAALAIGMSERRLLLTAATLCGNPVVDKALRSRLFDLLRRDPAGRIRLDSDAKPGTADEKRLYLQCWPGARTDESEFALAPLVVLDGGFDARSVMRLALRLDSAGAEVRRLAPDRQIPLWFGPQTVLLCRRQTRPQVLSSYPHFPERHVITDDLPGNDRELSVLLRRIDALLPDGHKLRITESSPEIARNLWEPSVFKSGVYRTRDASFLTGAPRSSLYYLRRQKLLRPRPSSAVRLTFRDLVAVRTWTYLKATSDRKVSSRVVPALARFAGDSKAVKLGVTSNGEVLVDRGDGWIDVESGQMPLDLPLTDVDDVFRPFPYGNGTVVPLLNVSPNTKLHPEVLHGTPYLRGHRISAKGLACLEMRGGRDAITAAYPELKEATFDDTVGIGHQLLRAP